MSAQLAALWQPCNLLDSHNTSSLMAAVYLDTVHLDVASVWQGQGAMGAQDMRS